MPRAPETSTDSGRLIVGDLDEEAFWFPPLIGLQPLVSGRY